MYTSIFTVLGEGYFSLKYYNIVVDRERNNNYNIITHSFAYLSIFGHR